MHIWVQYGVVSYQVDTEDPNIERLLSSQRTTWHEIWEWTRGRSAVQCLSRHHLYRLHGAWSPAQTSYRIDTVPE